MRIIALAMLLAVMQTSPPVPRQAPDSNTGKGQPVQSDAKTEKEPSPQSPSPVQSVSPKPNQNNDTDQRDEDTGKSIRVRELPPVSVQSGWRDNVSLFFAGVIVLIGIVGVWAAIKTLHVLRRQTSAIRRQGLSMRRQTRILRNQLKTMSQSIEIENKTIILQYRPKIVVRSARALQFSFELGEPGECELQFLMVNQGGSPARIAAGSFIHILSCVEHAVGKIEMKEGDRTMLSAFVLQPGQQVTIQETLPTGTINDVEWANFREGLKTDPLRFMFLMGTIHYLDDLDIPRATGISRKYDAKTGNFEPDKDSEQEYSD